MQIMKIVEDLCKIGERQFEGADKARDYIKEILSENMLNFKIMKYIVDLPRYKKFNLTVDGKEIKCLPTGLKSGKIDSKYIIINSLFGAKKFINEPNINFSPVCDSISRSSFFHSPSIAVNRDDILKICKAKKLKGNLVVKKESHQIEDILVGNIKNPEHIIFAHYDSIEIGAIDNASGVAFSLSLIVKNKNVLDNCLFVFCGNEEVSYDEYSIYGYGYRVFEKRYSKLLKKCKSIIVTDCLGFTKNSVIDDLKIIKMAFPIKKLKEYSKKIKVISGDFDKLMAVYQSPIDYPNLLKEEFFNDAEKIVLKLLK